MFDVQVSALIFGKLDNNEQQDDEAIALLKAANILRRDMVDHGQSFNGKFALTELCTYVSVFTVRFVRGILALVLLSLLCIVSCLFWQPLIT